MHGITLNKCILMGANWALVKLLWVVHGKANILGLHSDKEVLSDTAWTARIPGNSGIFICVSCLI